MSSLITSSAVLFLDFGSLIQKFWVSEERLDIFVSILICSGFEMDFCKGGFSNSISLLRAKALRNLVVPYMNSYNVFSW